MNWIDYINRSLKYIEENISDPTLNTEKLSKELYVSSSHFQRAFSIFTGISVGEYIRNRRLSIAAKSLLNANQSVLQTSLDAGYDSPEAFCKAFKRLHHVNPSDVKNNEKKFKDYPPLQIQIVLEGDEPLSYRITKKESFTIVGESINVSIDKDEYTDEIHKFWERIYTDGIVDELYEFSNEEIIMGASFLTDSDWFIYAIGVVVGINLDDSRFKKWTIESHTWAIFDCENALPETIDAVWNKIYSQWLPKSGYEFADAPGIEVFYEGKETCEIWLPVNGK